jgi:hypothetical protein
MFLRCGSNVQVLMSTCEATSLLPTPLQRILTIPCPRRRSIRILGRCADRAKIGDVLDVRGEEPTVVIDSAHRLEQVFAGAGFQDVGSRASRRKLSWRDLLRSTSRRAAAVARADR